MASPPGKWKPFCTCCSWPGRGGRSGCAQPCWTATPKPWACWADSFRASRTWNWSPFLLEELPKLGAAELATFDLILTTESHTPQVLNHLARHPFPPERLLSVAVSPTRETLITLARLPEDAQVTVCTETARFAEIITQHLSDLGHSSVQRALPGAEDEMAASTRCIVPPPAPGQPRLEDANTIYFDYQIDRGSLLRIEEAVTTLLLAKGERVMGGL